MSAAASRCLRLLAAGALAAIAVVPLAGAQSSRSAKPAARRDTVLVRIGAETITPATVQRRLDELPEGTRANFASPEGKQRLLERLVEERVWYQTAVKLGVADRAEIKRQLDQQRRDLYVRTAVNEVMAAKPAASDEQARAFYDAHEDEYKTPATVAISHIQVKTEAEGKRILAQAKRGGDWRKLVTQYSADTLTKKNGGALGAVTLDGVFATLGAQPAIAESAFAHVDGDIIGPYKTEKGWHVVRVEQKREAGMRTFDQMRPAILRQLNTDQSQTYYAEQLEKARKALGVKPDSAAIRSFVSQRRTARELFNAAQLAGPAASRIDAYRKLIQEYPDSDVSPQAQFMIGFIQSEELKNYEGADAAFRELLAKYPKSELASSAQWMIEHMRTEDAPEFMNLETDSAASAAPKTAGSKTGKP
jgi:peptidyl-prolyl cis-trans isomerase C